MSDGYDALSDIQATLEEYAEYRLYLSMASEEEKHAVQLVEKTIMAPTVEMVALALAQRLGVKP